MLYVTQKPSLRCVVLGNYIVEQGATVREAAQKFGISKSTVHKDVTEELYRIDRPLYERVRGILQKNKEERHLRGGEATRKKYQRRVMPLDDC
jgi:putative DeoR family transcriptional regulator (stage III sporulation protein D)